MNMKKQGLIGGGILVLALVAAVGIVYAAYSQSLTINGTANVKANSWKIRFNKLNLDVVGEAQEITAPTINSNDTKIGDYSVLISKPGDQISYGYEIINEGTFDATFTVPSTKKVTCTGTGDNAEQDAANVCKHLGYHVCFNDACVNLNSDDSTTISGTLTAGEIKTGIVSLQYSDSVPAEELPKNDVAISGLDVEFAFTQAE